MQACCFVAARHYQQHQHYRRAAHIGARAGVLVAQRLAWLSVWVLCLAFMSNAWALDVSPQQASVHIASGVSVHVQSDAALDMTQVRQLPEAAWTPVAGAINAGYSDKVHWFRFTLHNTSTQPMKRLLEVGYTQLDKVSLFVWQAGAETQQWHTGDSLPFHERPLVATDFVFPLQLPAAQTLTLYLQIQTEGALRAPLTLWSWPALLAHETRSTVSQSVYYGMLLVMALYNLFLFFVLRERAYLLFTLYLGSTLLFMSNLHGVAYRYAFPEYPGLNALTMLLSVPLTALLLALFTMEFLSLRQTSPTWHKLFQLLVLLLGLCLFGSFVLPYQLVTMTSVVLAVPVSLACLVVGVRLWRKGNKAARYYCLAWFVLLLGLIAMALSWVGLLSPFFRAEEAVMWGSILQVLLFSFALADRFNRERSARREAQDDSFTALSRQFAAERKLLTAVSHDKVTGLPTRLLLEEMLNAHLGNAEQELALVLLHLTRLNVINKTLGYEYADQVIKQFSERLEMLVRSNGCALSLVPGNSQKEQHVAHLDGSTFAFVLDAKRRTREQTVADIRAMSHALSRPIEFMDLSLDISFLVGCSFSSLAEPTDTQTLLRQAMVAFDRAGQEPSGVAVYVPEMNPYKPQQLTLMAELQHAIEADELLLYFQPQIHLPTRSVGGFEALVRWQHPERGFVAPDAFIPLAEQTRLIHPLTDWVIRRALEFGKQLDALGCDASVSVNVSVNNLREKDFSQRLQRLLVDMQVPPARLLLEITETAALVSTDRALAMLQSLRDIGVRLSIDDFGTGYSSLTYIRQMPVQEIKIDNSFIREMDQSTADATIVKSNIDMCHSLGFEVVAEGVETAEVQAMLEAMGCDLVQGYHIARPDAPAAVLAWLRAGHWALSRS